MLTVIDVVPLLVRLTLFVLFALNSGRSCDEIFCEYIRSMSLRVVSIQSLLHWIYIEDSSIYRPFLGSDSLGKSCPPQRTITTKHTLLTVPASAPQLKSLRTNVSRHPARPFTVHMARVGGISFTYLYVGGTKLIENPHQLV